jgi:hypothetical protein
MPPVPDNALFRSQQVSWLLAKKCYFPTGKPLIQDDDDDVEDMDYKPRQRSGKRLLDRVAKRTYIYRPESPEPRRSRHRTNRRHRFEPNPALDLRSKMKKLVDIKARDEAAIIMQQAEPIRVLKPTRVFKPIRLDFNFY